MRMKKALAELVHRERISRVATANAEGMPHLVPVCHVVEDGKIYFASGTDGRKVLNLKANPRVAVTVTCTRGLGPPQGRDGAGAGGAHRHGPALPEGSALLCAK
jgi:nitroimidazol reductase NimA-like FMN-containing flavoprotein (pyridoxamine 5'-phosphate oxidase superfamily)